MTLEFDSIVGILSILDFEKKGELFNAFLYGSPTQDYANILRLCDKLNIKALFSTNFDDSIEKTAYLIGKEIQVFTDENEYPDEITDTEILPLFKIHGGVKHIGEHSDIQADFSNITKEVEGRRLGIFKKYLDNNIILVIGYGGADYYDIYPLLFERKVIWISHEDCTLSILGVEDARNLKRKRNNIERLIACSQFGLQIKGNTQTIISSILNSSGINVEEVNHNKTKNWEIEIDNYYRKYKFKAIIDLANLSASCFGGLNIANDIFDFILKNEFEYLSDREKITSLLGRARTTMNPLISDLELAEQISRRHKDDITLILSIIEKAIALGNLNERKLAVKLLDEASQIAIENKSHSLAGLCNANIGHQYSKLKCFKESDKAYSKSEEFLRLAGNVPELFITLRNHAEMYAINMADVTALDKALPLYLEALSISWNRKFNDWYKFEMYTRVIVIFKFLFSDKNEVYQYLRKYSHENKSILHSGLFEHLINRIAKYGVEASNLEMEEWEY